MQKNHLRFCCSVMNTHTHTHSCFHKLYWNAQDGQIGPLLSLRLLAPSEANEKSFTSFISLHTINTHTHSGVAGGGMLPLHSFSLKNNTPWPCEGTVDQSGGLADAAKPSSQDATSHRSTADPVCLQIFMSNLIPGRVRLSLGSTRRHTQTLSLLSLATRGPAFAPLFLLFLVIFHYFLL